MFFGKKKKVAEPAAADQKTPAATPPAAPAPMATAPAAPAPVVSASPAAAPAAAAAPRPAAAPVSTAAGSPKHPLHALGEIVSLMMTSPNFKEAAMADLPDLVIPAIRYNQIAVAEARDDKGVARPVAAVLWARVSREVDQRLMSSAQFPPQVAANEWASGDIPWVVMAVGSQKACDATIAQISKSQLGGASMKVSSFGDGGTVVVREVSAAAAA